MRRWGCTDDGCCVLVSGTGKVFGGKGTVKETDIWTADLSNSDFRLEIKV